jgi:hypothetical protein
LRTKRQLDLVLTYFWGTMECTFEVLEADLEDRRKIILMKEELRSRIDGLSDFGRNTMHDSIKRLKSDLEFCEQEWLSAQRERALNRLSEALNIDRGALEERYWREYD